MAGDAPHNKTKNQAVDLPCKVIINVKEAAEKAILEIQPIEVAKSIYTKIKQTVSEPFTSFIDRLTQAVEGQCSDEETHPHLL